MNYSLTQHTASIYASLCHVPPVLNNKFIMQLAVDRGRYLQTDLEKLVL